MDITGTPIELIQELKGEIIKALGCNCAHVDSVAVCETFQETIVWEGVVEVFRLFKHDEAEWVYAWKSRKGEDIRSHIVLGISPVNSPATAVRASLLMRPDF